jgi:sugar lactone lactonase YvrE
MDGTPGANGIKLFGGHAFITVTARDAIMRVPLGPDFSAGQPEVFAERLRGDDFAVGADGSLYIATHPARSLVRLAPDGARTTLAAAEHGMTGATAVAFGRTERDRHCVYVTTTGGTMTLPPEQLEPARLVRVTVGAEGAPPGA